MSHMLPLIESDTLTRLPLHTTIRSSIPPIQDRITQLMHCSNLAPPSTLIKIDSDHGEMVTEYSGTERCCSTGSAVQDSERARTGLTIALDLIRPLENDNGLQKDGHLYSRSAVQSIASVRSPSVSSTPVTQGRPSSLTHSPTSLNESELNGNLRQDAFIDTAPPPKKLCSDDIPVLDSFPGQYGFDLYRPLCGDAYEATETKPSTAYFYFKDEQGWTNLYSKKTPTWWTLSYWCQRQPPEGSFIRLTPVYGTSDKQQEVIQRCFEDFMAIPTNSTARYSIVVVGNSLADYFFDPNTERLCVTLPYERPKEGCEYSQFNGKFMCFNSCLYNGGQGNKKPLFLIVTLERLVVGTEPSKGQCEVLGRQCIKFRSCACPKRDKENSERRTGDPVSLQPQTFGKRRKESERTERHAKRVRPQSQQGAATTHCTMKSVGFGSTRWPSSPTDHLNNEAHPLTLDDGLDSRNDGMFMNQEGRHTTISYNGESYHVLLVPTSIPGGLHTLMGVRHGLLRTWFSSPSRIKCSSVDGVLHMEDQKINPDSVKTLSDKANELNESYGGLADGNDTSVTTYCLQQLLTLESQVAQIVRERMTLLADYQTAYHYTSESTDSQPNSTGAVGLSMGSTDDPVSSVQDYASTTMIGMIPSEPGEVNELAHQQQQAAAAAMLQQSQIMHNMFRESSGVHRPPIYPNLENAQHSVVSDGSYEINYNTRFIGVPNSDHYGPPTVLPGSEHLRGISYSTELNDNYAMTQQEQITRVHTSPPTSTKAIIMDQHQVTSHQQQQQQQQRSSIRSVKSTTNSPVTVSMRAGISLQNAHLSSVLNDHSSLIFNSSAFCPTTYYGSQSNATDPVSVVGSAPRSNLSTMTCQANAASRSNICFYPQPVNSNSLTESLIIQEEVLNSYLGREKGFDETDMGRTIVHHIRSPSYVTSSSRSPGSPCCEELVPLKPNTNSSYIRSVQQDL